MKNETTYTRKAGTPLTEEEIAMVEAARGFADEYDEDNPAIDPVGTPELYAAMMDAVAERNRRVNRKLREA